MVKRVPEGGSYKFHRVGGEMNVFITCLSQYQCKDLALHEGVTHIMSLPWVRTFDEPAYPSVFYYYIGTPNVRTCGSGHRILSHFKEAADWLAYTARDINNKVLVCDDTNGRSAAAFCTLVFLTRNRHMKYSLALTLVEGSIGSHLYIPTWVLNMFQNDGYPPGYKPISTTRKRRRVKRRREGGLVSLNFDGTKQRQQQEEEEEDDDDDDDDDDEQDEDEEGDDDTQEADYRSVSSPQIN